ncbi:Apocarotenoid-15,15'-oxygenase [Galdieria sulphuraria]|nr:Apocarotenoid-15,15'-oxygenase [Galdieria sulphuraria]
MSYSCASCGYISSTLVYTCGKRKFQIQVDKRNIYQKWRLHKNKKQSWVTLSTLSHSSVEVKPTSHEAERKEYSWDRQAWLRGWENQEKEINIEIDLENNEQNGVTGELPVDIRGTLFRVGPARFRVGSDIVRHPWDGDGMVAAITFDQKKIWFRNRFVRTKGYMKESSANRILFRGTFGTQIPGGWLKNVLNIQMKNVANTNVLLWNRRLWALWEGGLPYELDPGNLITLGEKRFDTSIMSNFTAHPKIETDTGRLIGFSSQLGVQSSQLTFYEWDENFTLLSQRKVRIPGFGFYHDFAITPHYYILFQGPIDFTPWKFVLGLCSAAECMSFRKERPAKLFLVPRHSSAPVKELHVKSGFVFHFANAFEEEQEMNIDVVRVPDLFLGGISEAKNKSVVEQIDYESQVPRSCLYRYRVDLSGNGKCIEESLILDRQVEFPIVHPNCIGKRHHIIYVGINAGQRVSPIQGVAKVNLVDGAVDMWIPKPFEFAVEPIFIPKEGFSSKRELSSEDEGYLITLVYDGKRNRSYYAILDAQRVQNGPICTIQLPIAIPHGLHGMWSDELFSKKEAKQSSTYEIFYSKKWNTFQSDFPML